MYIRRLFCFVLLTPLFLQTAGAASFSLGGSFAQDDSVQLLNLSVLSTSTVTFKTYSYAGGTDVGGTRIAEGGFDPVLSLFSSTGSLIRSNDDGSCTQVRSDSVSGQCFDSYLRLSLTPGSYTLALTEYDNEPLGPALANGFDHRGQGNFTGPEFGPIGATGPFYDLFSNQRTSRWEVDILNASSASPVPEPATFVITGLGIALAALTGRQQRRIPKSSELRS